MPVRCCKHAITHIHVLDRVQTEHKNSSFEIVKIPSKVRIMYIMIVNRP